MHASFMHEYAIHTWTQDAVIWILIKFSQILKFKRCHQ